MKLFKYILFYSFVGIYQSVLFVMQIPQHTRSLFSRLALQNTNKNAGEGILKGTLLRAAFRSIL